jgi:hypothetical protein
VIASQLSRSSLTFLIGAMIVCCLLVLALRPWRRALWRYWMVSAVFTVGGFATLANTIQTASSVENLSTARGEVTRSTEETLAILSKRMDLTGKCVIPTGVQVQGFKFETSLDLEMHGYLWQTYPKDCPKEVRGYTVPEASDGGFERRVIRRSTADDGSEKVLYQFQTVQRQLFFYEHYPFDYQSLWLRLWSLDFDGSAILVPDFESYPPWVDEMNLGIDPDAEIGGFALDFTRWTVFFPPTATSFGLEPYDGPPERLGLYYNVGFHRLLVGPLVNHLIPVAAIIFLTFAALMFVHTDEDRATTVLTFLGALLFASIFNDQGIRSSVAAAGYSVVSLYSVISYVLLILVSLNTIVIAKFQIGWIERDNNLISKALFLPVTAWALAFVTHYALLG